MWIKTKSRKIGKIQQLQNNFSRLESVSSVGYVCVCVQASSFLISSFCFPLLRCFCLCVLHVFCRFFQLNRLFFEGCVSKDLRFLLIEIHLRHISKQQGNQNSTSKRKVKPAGT